MEASPVTCPHCGAAIELNSVECPYCHAALRTEACPKCFGLVYAGSKFCPHCGAILQSLGPADSTKLSCPRCKDALSKIQIANVPLDECTHCGGLWISVAAFDRVCSDTAMQTAATGLNIPPPVPLDIHVQYLHCPECSDCMNRTNFGGRSGVLMDVCKPHGIWLDRGELRKIIEFIRAGGMKRIHEDEMEQLNRARRLAEMEGIDVDLPTTHFKDGWAADHNAVLDMISSLSSFL